MAHYIGGFIKLFGDDLPETEEFAQLLAERVRDAMEDWGITEVEIDFEEKA